MKVKRYNIGRSNVGMLEQGRSALRSPGEVAREAYAPYEAVAEAAGTISQDFAVLGAKQQKAKAEKAAIDAQTQTTFMANAIDNLPVEAEKEGWTAEQMKQAGAASLKAYEDSLNAIDPEFQDDLRPAWQMNKAMYAQQIGEMTLQYEDKQNRQKMGASWIAAVDAKDPIQMQTIKDLSVELRYVDPEEASKMDGIINTVLKENAVDEIFNEWQFSDNPDAVYSRLVNNDSMDDEVKSSAITKIEGQINNEASLDRQRTQQAGIAFEREYTDMRVLAKQGKLSADEIERFVGRIDSFDSPTLSNKGSGWRTSLYLATLEGVKTGVDNTVFARQLSMGPGSMVGDEKNYKNLQSYAEEIIPDGATTEERDLIENNLTRVAGFPTQRIHKEMKAAGAGYNSRSLIRAATRVLEITDGDPYTGVDLGLTGPEMANVMRVVNAMTSQIDPVEAATEVVEYNKKLRDEHVVSSVLQKQAGNIDTTGYFDDLFGSAYDEMVYGPWGQSDITTAEETTARIRYNQYFREAYLRTDGDEDAAKLTADMRFQQTHAMTYINGEPELQFGGIRAGSKELGDVLWENDLKGMTVIGLNETDSFVLTLENRDDIKFRDPQIINGRQRYQVYVNDRPAFSETDVGRRSVFVEVDQESELAVQDAADTEEIKGIQENIERLESELRRIQREGSDRTDYDMPQYRQETTGTERDIPKEIAMLQRQLRKLQ